MAEFEDQYEARFHFINDPTLRRNLGDALQQVAELTGISEAYEPIVKAGFLKMAIVITASIVEAVLHAYIKTKITHPILKNDWKYGGVKTFEVISETPRKEIITAYREKAPLDLDNLEFNDLIKILHDEELWQNGELEKKVDDLRKKRNNIHLMTLGRIDREYSKEMVDEIFSTARKVILMVEESLNPSLPTPR
jgi:hypothetical protein